MMTIVLFFTVIILLIIISLIIVFYHLNTFTKPTGKYGVGNFEQYLIDNSRVETNNPKEHRELMLHIWYPIDEKINSPKTLYDKDALRDWQKYINRQTRIPKWLLTGLNHTKIFSQKDKPISKSKDKYPVILISSASDTLVQHYSWIIEELASNGYIVIGINHPYMAAIITFPDGRITKSLIAQKKKEGKQSWRLWKNEQMEIAIKDVQFVLNTLSELNFNNSWPLYNKLDLNNVGIVGHSFAGSLAMLLCVNDSRIKAGIALDSQMALNNQLKTFNIPFLQIIANKSHQWENEEGKIDLATLIKWSKLPGMQMYITTIKNVGHGTFMDLPLLLNQTLFTQILSNFIDLDIDASSKIAVKAIEISKKEIVNFFDQYLTGKDYAKS